MAIITSTTNDISLSSSYYCYNTEHERHYYDGDSSLIVGKSTSAATTASATLNFTYNIGSETINAAILQMKAGNSAYGGTFKVNGKALVTNNGVYTAYLDVTTLGKSSGSVTVTFTSNTPTHTHYSDYDSRIHTGTTSTTDTEGNYIGIDIYRLTKQHTGALALSEITLMLYIGNDSIAVPSMAAAMVGVDGVAKKISNMFIGINGVAKKITTAWIGIDGVARKIYPAYTVGSLIPGEIIQLDETGTGTYTEWIVMHHGYYEDGTTVLMRKTLLPVSQRLAWEGDFTKYGYPYFDKIADKYLTETWLLTTAYQFQELLVDTTITGRVWSSTNGVEPVKSAVRKIWIPSAVNLSATRFNDAVNDALNYYDDPEGAFNYFTINDTNAKRIAYDANGTAQPWWTRTVVPGTHPNCRKITESGSFGTSYYYYLNYIRPVINVYSNNYLEKISEGVYRMIGGGKAV